MAEWIWLNNEWPNLIAWALALAAGYFVWWKLASIWPDEIGRHAALGLAVLATGAFLRVCHVLHIHGRRR